MKAFAYDVEIGCILKQSVYCTLANIYLENVSLQLRIYLCPDVLAEIIKDYASSEVLLNQPTNMDYEELTTIEQLKKVYSNNYSCEFMFHRGIDGLPGQVFFKEQLVNYKRYGMEFREEDLNDRHIIEVLGTSNISSLRILPCIFR